MMTRSTPTIVAFAGVLGLANSFGYSQAPLSQPASQPAERDIANRTSRPAPGRRQRPLFPIQWVNRSNELPVGVRHRTFHSQSMNREVGFCVYTPPDDAVSDKRYPVMYWLHGRPGNELLGRPHAAQLHKAIVNKRVPPMIMVLVNGGRGSMYCDFADKTVMSETMIIEELIPYIDKHYRTIARREGRVIEGFSMGGFGALKFAFKYPELFCSVVGGAPALVNWERVSTNDQVASRIFAYNAKAFESQHPTTWLKKNADKIRGRLRIRIVIGDEDRLKPYNDALCEELKKLNVPYEYEVIKGIGHSRGRVYEAVGLKGFQFQAESLFPRSQAPQH